MDRAPVVRIVVLEEIITTGKSRYHEELKKQIPVDVTTLASGEGIGPKILDATKSTLTRFERSWRNPVEPSIPIA